jgi:hypothetical protein
LILQLQVEHVVEIDLQAKEVDDVVLWFRAECAAKMKRKIIFEDLSMFQ